MTGRFLVILLVLATVLGGAGMYYLQVYAYYDRMPAQTALTLEGRDGPVTLAVRDFQGIDSESSPLRRRACFVLAEVPQGLTAHPRPTPLNAPSWFGCFDAARIDADLTAGRATAWLVEGNFRYGFDRVMAVYPDGRAYLWSQMNACGSAHFDGRPLPAGCPPPPGS